MKNDDMELLDGSGNAFADLGFADAPALQLKALLGAQIIGVLNDRELSVRKAEEQTGIAASEFSRIRRAKLGRFTIDRLMNILARLDQDVDVKITVRPHTSVQTGASI